MNKKNISRSLTWKINGWIKSIKSEGIRNIVKENVIVTGGAFVSLLNGDKPNDYDVYFKTIDSLCAVVDYYIFEWKKSHPENFIDFSIHDGRVMIRVKSSGMVAERDLGSQLDEILAPAEEILEEKEEKYRPVFISTNAITLSNDIQIVVRFCGSVEEIHKNYDFTHTTCSFDYKSNEVSLPAEALECIINKELRYQGSRYPLASIIRTRKFIERGWTINAGQYLKMALQLNELDLSDPDVLEDQLVGVDLLYFMQFIETLKKKKEEEPNFTIDNMYLFEVINRIF